jgi:hypothetical protein
VRLQGLATPPVDLYYGSVRDSANKVVATIAVQVIP